MNRKSTLEKAQKISKILQEYLKKNKQRNVRIGNVIGVINRNGFPYSENSFREFLRNLRDSENLETYLPQAYQRKKKGAKRGYWYFTYVRRKTLEPITI